MALLQIPEVFDVINSNFLPGVLINFLNEFKNTLNGLALNRFGLNKRFHQRVDNIKLFIYVLNDVHDFFVLIKTRVNYF